MKKLYIVKKKEDFNTIIKKFPMIKNKYFVIYYRKNNLKYDRFGISVGKKIGNAVVRNKYKRRIRNIIDIYKKDYIKNQDYIIILRVRGKDADFQTLKESLVSLLLKGE